MYARETSHLICTKIIIWCTLWHKLLHTTCIVSILQGDAQAHKHCNARLCCTYIYSKYHSLQFKVPCKRSLKPYHLHKFYRGILNVLVTSRCILIIIARSLLKSLMSLSSLVLDRRVFLVDPWLVVLAGKVHYEQCSTAQHHASDERRCIKASLACVAEISIKGYGCSVHDHVWVHCSGIWSCVMRIAGREWLDLETKRTRRHPAAESNLRRPSLKVT